MEQYVYIVGYFPPREPTDFSAFTIVAVFKTELAAQSYIHHTTKEGSGVYRHLPLEVSKRIVY
jgi:hypothetical protein